MKNRVIGLGAALLLAAPFATPALADPSGFVSIGAGPAGAETEFMGSSNAIDGFAVEALASGVYMFTPVLGVQGDVRYTSRTFEDVGGDMTTSSVDGALHGFYRESDQFLVGGFVQIGRDSLEDGSFTAGTTDRSYIGGEAQVFLGNATLYAQAGMQQFDVGSGMMSVGLSGWFGTVEARYFLTPDLRIEAHAGFNTLEFDIIAIALNTATIGVGAEYKFESLPISLFAKYDYTTTSFNDDGGSPTMSDHRFLVGARFAIGEDTLLDRDRNGASLRPVQSHLVLSNFGSPP